MTVRELIEKLSQFNPESPVQVSPSDEYEVEAVPGIVTLSFDGYFWVEEVLG